MGLGLLLRKYTVILACIVALTGIVAGSVTLAELSSSAIQPGDELELYVTVDNAPKLTHGILDANKDGSYDPGIDFNISRNISKTDTYTKVGTFNSSNTSTLSEGSYTVYAFQDSSTPSSGMSLSGYSSASLEIDSTSPSISNFNVTKLNFYRINVSFVSDENISSAEVSFNTSSESINEFNINSTSPPVLYWSTYGLTQEGMTNTSLTQAQDEAGNDGASNQWENVYVNPFVTEFSLINPDSLNVDVRVKATQQLSHINTSLGQDASGYLSLSNFKEENKSSKGEYWYTANVSDGVEGEFNATLISAKNQSSVEGASNQSYSYQAANIPNVQAFYFKVSGSDINLHLDVDEDLSEIKVNLSEDVTGTLNKTNFTETQNGDYWNYTSTVASNFEGRINATLESATDEFDLQGGFGQEATVETVEPTITDFNATNISEAVNIYFNSSEKLDGIDVEVSGAATDVLTESDFSTSDTSSPHLYEANYSGVEGSLNFTLKNATDKNGNNGASNQNKSITLTYPPTIHEFDLFANNQDVDLEINTSEQLQKINVTLTDDVSGNLYLSNFTETSPNSYYIYTANVSNGTEGEFGADLDLAEDTQSLDGSNGESDFLLLDNSAPPDPNTTTIVDSPITKSNEESVTVEVNFTSTTETGELDVRFDSSNGSSVIKTKSVSSTNQLQSFDFNLTDVEDGEIEAESRMTDEAGNVNSEGFTANSSNVTKDTTPPTIENVITGDSLSGESTARDVLTVEFSDNMVGLDVSSVSEGDFTVTSNGQGVNIDSLNIDSGVVKVNLAEELHTGATPTVDIIDIGDEYGNSIDTNEQRISSDGLKPQILSAQIDSELSTDSKTFIEVNFSEDLSSSGGTVTIDGKTVNFESDTTDTSINSVDYEELLDTGKDPKLTAVSSVDDGKGNTATVENGEVTIRTFIKDIETGLNFVSFPIADQSNPSISNILPENKVNVIWAYYDGEWKTYNPESENNDFNSFKGGYGYIIEANQEFTLNPNVNTVASSNVAEYPVNNGWNLIGQMQEYNQEADSGGAISSTVGVNEIHKRTDETSSGYKRIDSGAFTPEDMKPGNGYWMNSSDSNSLLTPNFAASQSTIVIEMVRGIASFIGQVFSFLAGVVG